MNDKEKIDLIRAKFSDKFLDTSLNSAIASSVLMSLVQGADAFQIIEHLIGIIEQQSTQIQELYENKPLALMVSQESIILEE